MVKYIYINIMWKMKRRVYLDFAAAAPVSKKALHTFVNSSHIYANPSSPHTEGRDAHTLLENARATIALLTEVKPDDIIFTSGATEANTLAMRGYVSSLIRGGRSAKDIHILYAPTSHASIVRTAQSLSCDGVQCEPLQITSKGQIDIEALAGMVRPNTALVSMDAVSGETGTIWNTREVRNVIEKIPGKYGRALLHVDASQVAFTQKLTRSHWGADMLVMDAQKVGAVRGVGILIAHRTIPITPLLGGGDSQERGIRPGTEPVALATAFAQRLSTVANGRDKFYVRATHTRRTLEKIIINIKNCIINDSKNTVPHILNISLIGRDTDYLVLLLDEKGFAVSARAACETGTNGSRSVLALTANKVRAISTLRISWGPSTRISDIARFGHALIKAVEFLDEHGV